MMSSECNLSVKRESWRQHSFRPRAHLRSLTKYCRNDCNYLRSARRLSKEMWFDPFGHVAFHTSPKVVVARVLLSNTIRLVDPFSLLIHELLIEANETAFCNSCE